MSKLRTGVPCQFHDVTIIPIERMHFFYKNKQNSFWAYGAKEPVAVIIRDAQGVRVLGIESTDISMESLHQELPDLINILADLQGT